MFKKMNRNSSMIISVIHRRPYCQITSSWSFLVYSVSFILCLMNIPSVLSIKTKQQSQNLCFDLRQNCKELAKNNQCNNNSLWMSSHCPVSCNTCHLLIQLVSIDESFNDIKYRTDGKTIPAWGSDIGIPQIISDDKIIDNNMKEKIIEILERARSYVNNNILVDKKYDIVREKCRNYNESCVEWAFDGWCEDDPTYMSKDCGPTCRSCDLLHVDLKCPLPHINDVMNAWNPGDLNKMFESIVSNPSFHEKYDIKVLSRPFDDDTEAASIDGVLNGPWVITIDNFLNETEANRLIELGAISGYQRSTDLGKVFDNGEFESKVSTRRTSTNAWCNNNECLEDSIANAIYDRMEYITGIPMINSESFQLLRYEKGQFYKEHHDYINEHYDRSQGVRMLTIFLYLNDVKEGGGTNFPQLNLTVQPVLGRALLWPSVFNDRPHIRDPRTNHQALAVEGENEIKFGANVWVHQREWNNDCP